MTAISASELEPALAEFTHLSPDIHWAAEQILTHCDEGSLMANIDEAEFRCLQKLFAANEGRSLPTFRYNADGEYVRAGSTPGIELRHQHISYRRVKDSELGLWLEIPTAESLEESLLKESVKEAEVTETLAMNDIADFDIIANNKPFGLVVNYTVSAVLAFTAIKKLLVPRSRSGREVSRR